jgi:hypothetical protein
MQQWRSTSNALEAVAESPTAFSDELGQISSKDLGSFAWKRKGQKPFNGGF